MPGVELLRVARRRKVDIGKFFGRKQLFQKMVVVEGAPSCKMPPCIIFNLRLEGVGGSSSEEDRKCSTARYPGAM